MKTPHRLGACVAASLIVGSFALPAHSVTRYVKQNSTGANNGTSWTDAFTDLQAAVDAAISGDELWVATGTYRPTTGTNRSIYFRVNKSISLYGGFAGTENSLSEREWRLHDTILSGDLGTPGDASDNSYAVILIDWTFPGPVVFDGFIVEDAHGTESFNGGGMISWATNNTIRNSVFRHNHSGYGGGGLTASNNPSTTVIENTLFIENSAEIRGGGMWSTDGVSTRLVNVLFLRNSAPVGSAWEGSEAQHDIVNVTFSQSQGGSAVDLRGTAHFYNSLFWANPFRPVSGAAYARFRHCIVPGSGGSVAWNSSFGTDLGGNLDADPNFIDPDGDDLHLDVASPAIDSGDNAAPWVLAEDLDGLDRIQNGVVDMGAYEAQFACTADSILYVDASAPGVGTGSSWETAFATLPRALLSSCEGIRQIWVAAGTYTPTKGTDRSATFQLRNGLRIYGGFAGTESSPSERYLTNHHTVLSGEIGSPTWEDNSYHVVTGSGCDATAVLDGCTITRGYAGNGAAQAMGGGIFNAGGSPTLTNLVFDDNQAATGGGALANYLSSSPVVVNAVFIDNGAGQGGAVYNVLSNPLITNATFEGNYAPGTSSIHNVASNPTITNSIIWGNTGAPIGNQSSTPLIDHCLLEASGGSGAWNATFGIDAGGNIDADPLYANAPGGDLHIGLTSPAVDAGNGGAPYLPSLDIEGNLRIIGADVDMGAYESDAIVGIGHEPLSPARIEAYPNPFNPAVTIAYTVAQRAETRVEIYDVRGTRVRELVREVKQPGAHRTSWDGKNAQGASVSSGIYFVRFTSGTTELTRKITLLK